MAPKEVFYDDDEIGVNTWNLEQKAQPVPSHQDQSFFRAVSN